MSVLGLILVVALIGILVGLAMGAERIPPTFKSIIWWVGIVCVVVIVLQAFGILDLIRDVQVPRFHGR